MNSATKVIVYAFVAHWVWSETGWLAQLGVHDFAGGWPTRGAENNCLCYFGGSNKGIRKGSIRDP